MCTRIVMLAILATVSPIGAATATDTPEPVAYPEGYRHWHHVKSMVINEGHPLYESFGGMHHLYANDKAMEGYRTGDFPDGAVIVFDLLAADSSGNAITEGERKVLGVMEKKSLSHDATGGWGFEGFANGDPENRAVGADAESACFQCHTARAEADYVFSTWRE